ncbi:MAG TPA: HlyD family efflux transporter periplasmic adaptor subunit [Pseudolabrys sp.]|nr:HlyD family efflux transporter periplasmic adaptor subunit [Pseudolabrys sp.]
MYSVPSQLLLFRQEVIDFQQHNRQWGQVALLQPLSTKIIIWFIAAAVSLFVAFLFFGQYARKETVIGYLTPAAGTAKIFAPRQGTFKEIYVKEGQQVEKDQPLLAVETSQIAANGEDINVSMLAALEAQRNLLTNQIAAEQERMKSERARLTALTGGLMIEISELQAQIESQKEAVRVSRDIVSSVTELKAKGLISALEYAQRELAALGQKQKSNSLNQELAARQNQLTETRYSLEQLPTVMAGKIQSLRSELSTTEQRVTEISGRRAYVIRAPDAGRISTLQATVGQFADPRRPQMEIIPNNSALQAELFIPTRGIGFVKPGQEVRILYEAFPHQQFGTYGGRINEISQTILSRSDASGPIELKEPAYRVIVALDRPDIDAYGKRIPLQPGMLLNADIILEKRSLLRWFLGPLLSVRM